jgi:hypothetical protein
MKGAGPQLMSPNSGTVSHSARPWRTDFLHRDVEDVRHKIAVEAQRTRLLPRRPRKALVIMIKDKNNKYAATETWGWQAWADPNKPLITDPTKQCFECHQAKKDKDYAYSTHLP